MKSKELIELEKKIKEADDKDWLLNIARVVLDQAKLASLREEIEKIEERMLDPERAMYTLEVPILSDEEINFASEVLKGKFRILGEELPKDKEDGKPQKI